ncbi:penicillin-binding protein 2 [Effusibacillus dendaii]|uniref:Penicillin-binding protein 2 n=1 Tax=Effusibacillus dendaii TaxID=2743772 RepID=A0A7I8DD64_9BACL|nr:penicillin-binding protein 2 [Effusibacillus dendaii]BCJ88054.1 penicillin-binding protein 2 [Effusibacillus dendaii]
MEAENQPQSGSRLQFLFLILFLALVILLLRLSFIQLGKGAEYQQLAEENRYAQQVLPAPRGRFIDRNGEVLVANKPSFTIQYTDPYTIHEKEKAQQNIETVAEKLVPLLKDPTEKENLSKEQIISIMKGEKDNLPRSAPRKIKQSATDQQVARIREHLNELPGIAVIPEAIRDYRLKTFASNVIGYLHSIRPEKWPEYRDKGYQMSDLVGSDGLEQQYEQYLKGVDGATRVEVNINGDRVDKNADYIEKKPIPGNDVILTIDKKLQQATEQALAERVTALQKEGGGRVQNAAAVAMDPNTGEVLAMASYPPYDPNDWVDGVMTNEEYARYSPGAINRAVYPFAPGSTVKMLTTMIGLREGVIKPDEKILCTGGLDLSGYYALDWLPQGHGWINGKEAIAGSCNVYMYTVGKRLGKHDLLAQYGVKSWMEKYDYPAFEKFKKYQNEFGLGVETGIDLPYEWVGQYNYQPEVTTNMPFLAIGQNVTFTPIQLAQYVSTIANGGKRMQPFLAKEIVDPNGNVIKKTEPKVLNQVTFSQDLLNYVKDGMWQVTHEPYGTASYMFKNKPYNVAGKTGTAQTGVAENYWFVGYAPYDNPKIAIAVVVPDGRIGAHSYEMAGPIAETMLDTYFNVPPKSKP